jgi:hypothetical protein
MGRAAVAARDADFHAMLVAIDEMRGRQAREVRRLIVARFASTCPNCSKAIASGDLVAWRSGARAIHRACYGGHIERGKP